MRGALGAALAAFLVSTGSLGIRPTLILDAGHGGDDPGASVKRLREKNIALSVALKMQKALKKRHEAPRVLLTRRSDETLALDERVEMDAEVPGGYFLSLHVNDSSHRKDRGLVVYAYGLTMPAPKKKHNPVAPLGPPPEELARQSAQFALAIVDSLRAQKFAVEGVVHSDYYVLRNPHHPSVLVELGFLSNSKDRARLAKAAYQQKLADALARAVSDFLLTASSVDVSSGTMRVEDGLRVSSGTVPAADALRVAPSVGLSSGTTRDLLRIAPSSGPVAGAVVQGEAGLPKK